jgi:hypothetical protein
MKPLMLVACRFKEGSDGLLNFCIGKKDDAKIDNPEFELWCIRLAQTFTPLWFNGLFVSIDYFSTTIDLKLVFSRGADNESLDQYLMNLKKVIRGFQGLFFSSHLWIDVQNAVFISLNDRSFGELRAYVLKDKLPDCSPPFPDN